MAQSDVRRIVRARDGFSDNPIIKRDPQRSYMFEVDIHDSTYNASFGDLKYYVRSVEMPTMSREPIVYDYMDTRIMYSGRDSSSHSFSITFWDDQSLTVYDYMYRWLESTGSPEYGEGLPKKFITRDIKIKLKDSTDVLTTGSLSMIGCFPTEIGTTSLAYDNSDVLEFPVTFSYDKMLFGEFDPTDLGGLLNFKSHFGLV